MQTVKPSKHQLFCKPDEAQDKTESGFYISKSAVDKPKTAKVINVGSEVTEYGQNDTIVYKSYAPTEVKVNGDDYILVAEEDVLGKLIDVET